MSKIGKFLNLYWAWMKSHYVPSTFSVRMIPTDMCNLRCAYCWQRRDEGHEMTMEEFDSHLAKAKRLNVGIMTFLGGEPLTWRYIYDALAKCSKYNVLTDVTTNGTLLNAETIEKLGRAGLDYLNISVDGIKPNEVTRKNSIVRPEILECLKSARKKYKMHFRMNSVIYKNNFEEIRSLVEFSNDNGVQISLGYVVRPLDESQITNPGIYFGLEDRVQLQVIIDYILEKKKQKYPIIDPEAYFEGIYKYLGHEKFWECNYPTRYGWINVAPDGRVRSCTKKMDELDFKFNELDADKLGQIRQILADKVSKCNVSCYSNCAFDSYYYRTNKGAFLKKIASRLILNMKGGKK